MNKILAISLAASALLSTCVSANTTDISWDHFEVSYISAEHEVDGTNKYKPDGFSVKGLHELSPNFFTSFGYQSVGAEVIGTATKTDMDFNTFHVGLGFKSAINPTMEWYISGGALMSEIDTDIAGATASEDDEGYYIESGIRKQFSHAVEGDFFVRNSKYSSDSETSIEANIYHRVGAHFSLGFGVSISEEIDIYQVLLKYKY